MHTNRLRPADVGKPEGLPVTSVPRTIADVARAGLSEDHVARAIGEALQRGLTTKEVLLAEAKRRGGRAELLIRAYSDASRLFLPNHTALSVRPLLSSPKKTDWLLHGSSGLRRSLSPARPRREHLQQRTCRQAL